MDGILNCPRCRAALLLRRVTVDGRPVLVDVCARGCGGVWLDESDLRSGLDTSDDLIDVVPASPPVPVTDRDAPVLCPICQGATERFRWNYQSHVLLDRCTAGHGTWIDGGEVQEMEAWETKEALSDPHRSSVMARVHVARLEAETALVPDPVDKLRHPVVIALQNLYHKLV